MQQISDNKRKKEKKKKKEIFLSHITQLGVRRGFSVVWYTSSGGRTSPIEGIFWSMVTRRSQSGGVHVGGVKVAECESELYSEISGSHTHATVQPRIGGAISSPY